MTIEEAIRLAHHAQAYVSGCPKEFYRMCEEALSAQAGVENLWHDAKENPPKSPGLYYGKKDDSNSMWLCRYQDGAWTLDAYPEQKMHIVQWTEYTSFSTDDWAEAERYEPLAECKYCMEQEVIAWDLCGDGIVLEDYGVFHMLSGGDWEAKVRFCPMCGRRLNDILAYRRKPKEGTP